MKNSFSMVLLATFAIAIACVATTARAQGFGPGDGTGNCRAIDDDGDGVPNCLDPDYVRPQDGTGDQHRVRRSDATPMSHFFAFMHALQNRWQAVTSGAGHRYGPGDGSGTGEGPADGTGFGPGSSNATSDCDGSGEPDGAAFGHRNGRR